MHFEHETQLAGRTIKVVAEDFAQMVQAIAGIEELNQDGRHLYKRIKKEDGEKPDVVLAHRQDADENEYYGFAEVRTDGQHPRNVTWGQKRDKDAAIPFFPKGAKGYYDPSQGPGDGRRQGRQRPPQQSRERGQSGRQRESGQDRRRPQQERQPQGEQQGSYQEKPASQRHNEAAKNDDLPF